jgi:hypothetical protein
MHCPKCGMEWSGDDHFCRRCGVPLRTPITENSSVSGDNSFNAGQNNVFTGNNFSIGRTGESPVAIIDRVKVTRVTIGGRPLKVAWIIVSSVVGFVGSIVSIWTAWTPSYMYLWVAILGLSGMALLIGFTLSRTRFARVPPFLNLESNRQGEVFATKIAGECPKCDGRLRLKEVGPKNHRVTVVQCSRNSEHAWRFDPTVLGEVNY